MSKVGIFSLVGHSERNADKRRPMSVKRGVFVYLGIKCIQSNSLMPNHALLEQKKRIKVYLTGVKNRDASLFIFRQINYVFQIYLLHDIVG